MTENTGHVKLNASSQWDVDDPTLDPVLVLKIELCGYTSRKRMGDVLRLVANWIDEGNLYPFEMPTQDRRVEAHLDEGANQWIIKETNPFDAQDGQS